MRNVSCQILRKILLRPSQLKNISSVLQANPTTFSTKTSNPHSIRTFQSSIIEVGSFPKKSSIFIPHSKTHRHFSTGARENSDQDSWEQPINQDRKSNPSNRSLFKAIPINQSILSHIKSIGVGIRPKKKRKKKKDKNFRSDNSLLDEADERDFFRGQIGHGSSRMKRSRQKDGDAINAKNKLENLFMPPPPFSTRIPADVDDITEAGHRIKRLPVKVLGVVGSLEDKMPRSSKGLSEVAIVGRSNVGKSTLLNALLYGNQFKNNHFHDKKYIRGKTPSGNKIGKGVKAIVSDKPGETKTITFYQLSSYIIPFDKSGSDRKKVSLVLADLPGYGFAYAKEKSAQEWRELMNSFILHRGKSMKRILFLIDARHGFKKADFEFIDMLQDRLKEKVLESSDSVKKAKKDLPPIQLVLTKCDLVSQSDLARRVVQVKEQLSDVLRREPSALPVMLVSAKAGLGFNNIRGNRARGGILELQRELAALVPK